MPSAYCAWYFFAFIVYVDYKLRSQILI